MTNQPPLNPDALDKAALAMCHYVVANREMGHGIRPVYHQYQSAKAAVSAYLAAALPEVTSVEELEALPEGTILRDSYGLALHKRTANWWVTNCDSNLTSEDLADEIADTVHTYTVLYRPEVKP